MRLQLSWPHQSPDGKRWHVLKKTLPRAELVLFAQMDEGPCAHSFSLMTIDHFRKLPPWMSEKPSAAFQAMYSAEEIVAKLRELLTASA